jgi:flagellar biosynthesis protein FlhG
MVQIIPIASGKGGVGKSALSVNLAIALTQLNKTTVLIDLDLGAANLHTFLGIKNTHQGLGSLISKQTKHLREIILPTHIPKLHLICGDSFIPSAANIQYFLKRKILKEIKEVTADYIILDLGAGTSFNVIDFFLSSNNGILVVTPQLTSILNSFGFLRNAIFRLLFTSFPSKSQEREIIKTMLVPHHGEDKNSLFTVLEKLTTYDENASALAKQKLDQFTPRCICNMVHSSTDETYLAKLREISIKHLAQDLGDIELVPFNNKLDLSIAKRNPLILGDPNTDFSQSIKEIAQKLI